jgi:hypothetical protein
MASSDELSPSKINAFMTEVSEEQHAATPRKSPARHHDLEEAAVSLTSPIGVPGAHPTPHAGAAARLVAVALRDELAAARRDFFDRLDVAGDAQRIAENAATQAIRHSRTKDTALFELAEQLERQRLCERELHSRWQIAIAATGDRAVISNRNVRRELRSREDEVTKARDKVLHVESLRDAELSAANRRSEALEAALVAAEKLILELQRRPYGQETGDDSTSQPSDDGILSDSPVTPVNVEAVSAPAWPVTNTTGGAMERVRVEQQQDHLQATIDTLREANKELAARIAQVRHEHNHMSDRLEAETRRADAANVALRDAQDALAAGHTGAPVNLEATAGPDQVVLKVTRTLADKLEAAGGVQGLLQALSERTLILADVDDENRQLKEEIILLEARCVTTETRLHHSVEEGVATSILLERGIGRMKAKAVADADSADTRHTLSQAALTLRRALEREGYDTTTLPLAPDAALDLPYLRQTLSDHADMAAAHFHKGGGVVPSATRKPMIYL